MDSISQELQHFVTATEELLAPDVRLEKLNETERDIIQYYIMALAFKFATISTSEQPEKPMGTA